VAKQKIEDLKEKILLADGSNTRLLEHYETCLEQAEQHYEDLQQYLSKTSSQNINEEDKEGDITDAPVV
jgi:uncharacterized membrane-anchored protein YhcB (DUF1043 family)